MDLHSASEEDEQDVEVTEDHVDDGSDNDVSAREEPILPQTLMPFISDRMEEAVSTRPSSGGPAMDDSETESESDEEPTTRPRKRKSPFPLQALPPAKRLKTLQGRSLGTCIVRDSSIVCVR